jgi:hypothetical protein
VTRPRPDAAFRIRRPLLSGSGFCSALAAESKPDIQFFPHTAAAFFFRGQPTRADRRNANEAISVNVFDPLALSIGALRRFARQKKSRLARSCRGMPGCGAGHIITPPYCGRTQ